jgi:glucose-6-phosphate isomerase
VVTYAKGKLGEEPVRSQGHIHKRSSHSGWSPPEVYEIWSGKAIIYMQEYAQDDPGRCFAVYAGPGDVVVVPPEWAHATISADPDSPLTFGAWCDREYGFLYDDVRAHNGLAWYPVLNDKNEISWNANPNYNESELTIKQPEDYKETLGIEKTVPVYKQFEQEPSRFQFLSKPGLKKEIWQDFTP